MCGIAGILSIGGNRDFRCNIERMTETLTHRGPDDSGILSEDAVSLGFRRLSILDLEQTGHQPMTSTDGSCTIIYNGEIYNFIELRAELESLGYRFRSTGDTEVLLNAYCEWGKECLPRLNGMWAFLIYDRRRKLIFGSRDRFGIKPLFMHRSSRHVLFASEIKAIRESGLYRTEINWETAAKFLVRQELDQGDETFFSGIEQIPAGSGFEISCDGDFRSWRFWRLPEAGEHLESNAIEQYSELFEDAVRIHRRSDVPLAVFLSGGIDSTSILCSLARSRSDSAGAAAGPLTALSFMDPDFDESKFIGDTVAQTSAELERVHYSASDIWSDLPKILWYHDEPVHSTTALIGYRLSETAARHGIKVILNGQGADETAAGYHSYFHPYWQTLLSTTDLRTLTNEVRRYSQALGGSAARALLKVLARSVSSQAYRVGAYQRARTWLMQRRDRSHPWFSGDFLKALPPPSPGQVHGRFLDYQLRSSVENSPLPLYLRIEDRNAMAHSVEVRVPFLDFRLVELLFALPGRYKMRGPLNKYVVREAMRGKIPDSVQERQDKMGFPSPAGAWMTALESNIREVLNSRIASELGIFNVGNILRDFERHCNGEVSLGRETFNILQFVIWYGNTTENRVSAGVKLQ